MSEPGEGALSVESVEIDDGTPVRLFDQDVMHDLHYLRPGRSSSLGDSVVAADFEPHDETHQTRREQHQDIVLDDEQELVDRLKSAGILLCYFHDITVLTAAEKLMKQRVAEVDENPYSRNLESIDEVGAWHNLMVGRAYFGTLDDSVVDDYFHVILANGRDSGPEHATRVVEQACMEMTCLHRKYFSKRRGKEARRSQQSIDEAVRILVERLATVFDHEHAAVLKPFLPEASALLGRASTTAFFETGSIVSQGAFDYRSVSESTATAS